MSLIHQSVSQKELELNKILFTVILLKNKLNFDIFPIFQFSRMWRIQFLAYKSKTEGLGAQSCITSIYKLDYCGHFKPKFKSLRPSEAEIEITPCRENAQKRAWPFWRVRLQMKLRHHLGDILGASNSTYLKRN